MDAIVENLSKCDLSIGYFEEPDLTGHEVGPDSLKIKDILHKLDISVGYLIEKLKSTNQFDDTNLVFVSGSSFYILDVTYRILYARNAPYDEVHII